MNYYYMQLENRTEQISPLKKQPDHKKSKYKHQEIIEPAWTKPIEWHKILFECKSRLEFWIVRLN